MPTYEYMCKKKHFFIEHVRIDEARIITECPKCGEPAIRQMSKANIKVSGGTGRFHK